MSTSNAPDFDGLAAQLNDDNVAFGTANPVNDALQTDLLGALDELEAGEIGPTGVVVLETTGQRPGELRDLAQDLQHATGLDTVIVRTPASTAAVSDSLNRAQIEKGQYALIAEPDYAAGVRAFGAEAEGFTVPWGIICILILVMVVAAAAVSLASSRTQKRNSV
ncbi:DUF6676 family protein [uncultured Corynebacterium sp.]|uniref:Rv1476 family membrane protein n=1 Tax=uncultured Corynebacterium sp. TaxID=159447 RepID=UPI002630450C|nr:DUF6676 family protein [uncultured Corynebacterium sp.]